jgi:type VII secretion-associated serine protease mycosin
MRKMFQSTEAAQMSRIAVAALGVALVAAAQAPAMGARLAVAQLPAARAFPARALAAAAPGAAAPGAAASPKPSGQPSPQPSTSPKPPPKPAPPPVPVPVASMPGPTQNCPGTSAVSRVTQEPWAQRALGFSSVWPLSRGQGVTVAVVDSGVDFSRQLAGRVTAFDLTHTGLQDCVGHGTAVAAIIAASDIQAQGMPFEGVAPAARILSVKVNSQDTGSSLILARGIHDAAFRGAGVINVSITTSNTPELRTAVAYALHRNVVIVAAGGNDGTTTGRGPFYPASYPGVLSVGAVDAAGALAPFSDQRSHVAVTAPGVNITSAWPGGYQNQLSGTSFATPFVSGVAALVRARFPRMSAAQVVARIEATADGTAGPGTGNGLVNPVEAATAILGGRAAQSPSPSATPRSVSVSRTRPPDRSARTALAVALGSLGAAALVTLGAVVISQGRRRRWHAGRTQIPADGGTAGPPWP